MIYSIGALIAGILVGTIALPIFAVMLKRFAKEGRIRKADLTVLISLLFGSAILPTAIGGLLLDRILWPWYLMGEGIVFLPGAIIIAYRFTFKNG